MSIQSFSSYVCSVDACIVCIVSGRCNQCSFAHFMKSSCCGIDASTLSSMVVGPLSPSFLDTYSLFESDVELSRRPVCLVCCGNFHRNQITRLPLLSWRNHQYSPRCEFLDPNNGVLVPSDRFNCRSWFGWDLLRKEIAVYEENSSCRNHKNTKRDKQHFRFLYNKTFLTLLSLSRHRRNYTDA